MQIKAGWHPRAGQLPEPEAVKVHGWLLKNMREIYRLYRHYEDPLKSTSTYSYVAPRVEVVFLIKRNHVQSPFSNCLFGAISVKTHLQ